MIHVKHLCPTWMDPDIVIRSEESQTEKLLSPQFVVIHTVKGFGIVSKAEVDVILELSCFFDNPPMLAI